MQLALHLLDTIPPPISHSWWRLQSPRPLRLTFLDLLCGIKRSGFYNCVSVWNVAKNNFYKCSINNLLRIWFGPWLIILFFLWFFYLEMILHLIFRFKRILQHHLINVIYLRCQGLLNGFDTGCKIRLWIPALVTSSPCLLASFCKSSVAEFPSMTTIFTLQLHAKCPDFPLQ